MKGRYHRDQEKFPVPNNNIKKRLRHGGVQIKRRFDFNFVNPSISSFLFCHKPQNTNHILTPWDQDKK